MQIIEPDVATICTGMAASMGSVLLCAGAPGKRSALKHSRVMIHQPLGGAQGQASDILIAAKEIEKIREELYTIIAEHSGQPIEKIFADGERDYWMNSQEAKEYGMIDEILTRKAK
jgi:ATP-dependent Clp protease protease subunit